MALVVKEAIDKVEIVNMGDIPMVQVRSKRWVEDDVTGERFGNSENTRKVITPDDDVTEEEQVVKDIRDVVHTASVKAAYQAKLATNENSPL